MRIFIKKIHIPICLGFLSFSLPAPAHAIKLTLFEALRMAEERHVEAIVAQERVGQALERIRQAKAPLFPQFQASTYQYRRTFNLESIGIEIPLPAFDPLVGPFNTFDARLYLTQILFDATVLSRLKSSRLGQRISESELQKARQDAMALVANLFIEARRAQERIPLLQSRLRRDETQLQLARERRQLGLGSEFEITQAVATWEETRSQWSAAKTDALERRLDLAAALGLDQKQAIEFVWEEKIDRIPLPKESDFPSLLANHPEVESARRLVQQREQDRKTEVAAFYPQLTGNADVGTNGEHPGNADLTYNFGGQLSIPIFQGGLRKARTREAESRIREGQAQLEDTLRQQEAKAQSALATLQQALQVWRAVDSDLHVANRRVSLDQARLASGLGSRLEVLQGEADRAAALDQRGDAIATYYQARVNLAHSTGTLSVWVREGARP